MADGDRRDAFGDRLSPVLREDGCIDEAEFYKGDPGEAPVLTRATVEAAVSDYLSRSPEAAKLRDLAMVEASTPEGETAAVTLVAVARPALVGWLVDLVDDGIVITASSSARGQ